MERKVTVPDLQKMKEAGTKITALTAYDFPFAKIVDEAGIDVVLVGDTLGMVVQGLDTTLPVTLDEVIYHCRMVARARRRALLVGDLPFGSYQVSPTDALRNAGRLMKEGGVEAVKLEGGVVMADTIRAITAVEIPVMGHVGLTPQSVHRMGGFRVQGRDAEGARRILEDARALDAAGVFALVLEGAPAELAREVTASVRAPTIGIGAGPHCDGQVLVLSDLLGLGILAPGDNSPRFVRRYAELGREAVGAARHFIADVRSGAFPGDAESYHSAPRVEGPGPGTR